MLTALLLAAALPQIPFEKVQLPNGLTVIYSEDHRAPVVAVDLWYHVGAVNERKGRSGFAHLFELLYPQPNPYFGYVIGSREDLMAASVEDVKDFFRTYYAPNNASLSIVGDFETARTKPLVEKYFGPIVRGPDKPPVTAKT